MAEFRAKNFKKRKSSSKNLEQIETQYRNFSDSEFIQKNSRKLLENFVLRERLI